jgi:multiple sugar transport system substrate-binding protein
MNSSEEARRTISMHHGKRILAALLLTLVALSGCSRSTPAPAKQQPSTVSLRLGVGGPDPVMDALVSAFEAANSGVRIEKVTYQTGTFQELVNLIREEKIDVLPGYAASMLAPSLVQPLDPYLQKDRFDSSPLGRLEDLQISGRLYDLPIWVAPFILQYNQDIIAQAGVTPPPSPMTWEQFRETARKLSSGLEPDRTWGFHAPYVVYSLEIFVQEHSKRADWWNDLQAVHDGYQFFSELIWNDRSCPPAPQTDEFGRPVTPVDAGFAAGKAAMTIGFVSNLKQVTASQIKLGNTLLPIPTGGQPVSLARPFSLSIAATSKNMETAWQFVRFAAGADGAAIIAKAGAMPAYRTPDTMQIWAETLPANMAGLKPLATMPLKLKRDVEPNVDHANEYVRAIGYDALSGKMTWQEALERFKTINKNAH